MKEPEVHFIVFGTLYPIDNGYRSTAVHLLKELATICNLKIYRVPSLGEYNEVVRDPFDDWCESLKISVKRVTLDRRLYLSQFLGGPLAVALRLPFGVNQEWLAALREAGTGSGDAHVICLGPGWDVFSWRVLQYFNSAYFFPQDSITLFESNRISRGVLAKGRSSLGRIIASLVEIRYLRSSLKGVFYVGQRDARIASKLSREGMRVAVVRLGVAPENFKERARFEGEPTLIFTGVMSYGPNRDAVQFLIDEILPRLRTKNVRIWIVGKDASRLPPVSDARIVFIDWVPDILDYLVQATIFISPLQSGAGAKNKVLHAMAAGLPVIGTTISFSGFESCPPGAVIRDCPADFAEAVDELIKDRESCARLGALAIEYVFKCCSWRNSAKDLLFASNTNSNCAT